jgi:AAHS family 4-hydroxybenzoate transporter-like MFS transporter
MAFTESIDVPALLDHERIGSFRIELLVLCFMVLVMDGYDVLVIGNLGPSLAQSLRIARPALGPVFSAGIFGLALGALFFGPLADWLGRRRMIIASTVFFGICTLLTARATSVHSLLVLRFATGLGLGGAFPNAIALMSEFAPQRVRYTLVTLMQAGFAAGGLLSGVIVSWLIDAYGWRTVLYIGGVVPLLLAPLLVARLPESIRFLVIKGARAETIGAVLSRAVPGIQVTSDTAFVVREENRRGVPMLHLFREGRAVGTALLWLAAMANILALTFLLFWLPTLINSTGIALRLAVWSTVAYQVGSIVGAVLLGRLVDLRGTYRVLPINFVVGAVIVSLLGLTGSSLPLIVALSLGVGFCTGGGQVGLNALPGTYYPTYIRSTGVGWALGVGRFGAVISGLLGTLLLSWRWSLPMIFIVDGFFVLCAAAAVFLMGLSLPRPTPAVPVAVPPGN